VLLAIVFVIAQAVRPLPAPALSMTASQAYTFQGAKPSVPWPSEGQAVLDVQGLGSFGSYGKQKPVPIASVAKVMTAYVILRDHPIKEGTPGAAIPVDKKAEKEAGLSAQNESTVEVKRGEKLSQQKAIEAIMIASANNVARLLARWDAGSEKAFAKKMNAAADDLGMTRTKYTDPSGLNASTVSTAQDQVKLARKVMGIDLIRDTVRLKEYTDSRGDKHDNWNNLVPAEGVIGIKTGTTTKAGGNLLFAATRTVGGTEQLIIGAVLGQYQPPILDTVLAKSKRLMSMAQQALRAQKVVQKGEVVGYVDDQLGGRTPVVATRDVTAVGWSGLKVKLALTDSGKVLPHEGKAGDRAGTLTVGDGPGQVKVPLALKDDMTEPGFGAKLTRIL
jgi:D-alanyl-D-alanine carboxypeptidase